MAQIFPKWANKLPALILIAAIFIGSLLVGFVWYFGSPEYTDVGYQPRQPVEYNHKVHAGDLGLDCRYCHNYIEVSPNANIPPTQTCMNCHKIVLSQSEKMIPVINSWNNDEPLEWNRVHKLPDYVYFDHSMHLYAGIGCFSCHGNIAQMEKVTQVKPLSMSWCLDCHRNPTPNIRPLDKITSMDWEPSTDQAEMAEKLIDEKNIAPPTNCSGCHR
ncbi:MAG: cytochrome c3 family protein [Candidatus Zixiibacteriota bacterium]